jgi:hypothetical protein
LPWAQGDADRTVIGGVRHTKGCNCKKSGCLKKYCECFQAGIFCSRICKCQDCKNYEVSEGRGEVFVVSSWGWNLSPGGITAPV